MTTMIHKILLAIMTIATISQTTNAVLYIESWDLQTNLTHWAASHTFQTNDVISFIYTSQVHTVLEVSKPNYDSCTTSNPISTSSTGNTTITLTSTQTRYFICGVPGHCSAGMKAQIDVVSAPPLSPGAGSPGGIVIGSSPGSAPVVITGADSYDSAAGKTVRGAGIGIGLVVMVAALLVV